jgi:hypothetical protein
VSCTNYEGCSSLVRRRQQMMAQARRRKASWMSSRIWRRMRSRRNQRSSAESWPGRGTIRPTAPAERPSRCRAADALPRGSGRLRRPAGDARCGRQSVVRAGAELAPASSNDCGRPRSAAQTCSWVVRIGRELAASEASAYQTSSGSPSRVAGRPLLRFVRCGSAAQVPRAAASASREQRGCAVFGLGPAGADRPEGARDHAA